VSGWYRGPHRVRRRRSLPPLRSQPQPFRPRTPQRSLARRRRECPARPAPLWGARRGSGRARGRGLQGGCRRPRGLATCGGRRKWLKFGTFLIRHNDVSLSRDQLSRDQPRRGGEGLCGLCLSSANSHVFPKGPFSHGAGSGRGWYWKRRKERSAARAWSPPMAHGSTAPSSSTRMERTRRVCCACAPVPRRSVSNAVDGNMRGTVAGTR